MSNYQDHNKDTEKKILSQLRKSQSFEQGFSALVQTYQERLYWHIRSIVGQHHEADEVLQNTFIKIYKGLKNFRGEAALYTWMHRIATNESLSYLKKQKRRATVALDESPAGTLSNQGSTDSLDGDQITRLLQRALETLPNKQQQVFLWRYYENLSYQEISNRSGTSVGGLKASYHHAVKKIETFVLQYIDQ
ncbi:MAG: RNA polymerase sigma factor [Aureispira sp.]